MNHLLWNIPDTSSCGTKGDILFLLDNSGSISQSNFELMLEFVKDVVKKFTVDRNQVQFGLETFETGVRTEFKLNTYSNRQEVLDAVGRVSYVGGGGTNTGGALQHIREKSFSQKFGKDFLFYQPTHPHPPTLPETFLHLLFKLIVTNINMKKKNFLL